MYIILPPLHITVLQLLPSKTAVKEANQNIYPSDKVKRDELLTLFARWSVSYCEVVLSKTIPIFFVEPDFTSIKHFHENFVILFFSAET